VILPQVAADFVAQLPIEKFHGIGSITAAKLNAMGIYTGADLRERSLAELVQRFGKVGQFYYQIAWGEDARPVVPDRVRKSISVETSYDPDLTDQVAIEQALEQLVVELYDRLERLAAKGQTLTLKVKFADYSQVTRSLTQTEVFSDVESIWVVARRLLAGLALEGKALRLLGLGVGKLVSAESSFQQLLLGL
jgi:DNA polymerase IV